MEHLLALYELLDRIRKGVRYFSEVAATISGDQDKLVITTLLSVNRRTIFFRWEYPVSELMRISSGVELDTVVDAYIHALHRHMKDKDIDCVPKTDPHRLPK